MALTPLYKYFMYNNELCDNSLFKSSENYGGIYEVLRVEDGVPLFMEEHLKRFYNSAKIAKKEINFSGKQIENLINTLVLNNGVDNGNILISCKTNLKAFFIAHNYPTDKMYNNGVTCGILKAERKNPNAKIFQTSVRDSANKLIEEKGYYEIILANHLNHITEGSRSNVFFVRDNKLITPPGNDVLLGITRKKTIELAAKLHLDFSEEDVSIDRLSEFSAAFITGTSPKILPVSQLEDFRFNAKNEMVIKLMHAHELLIQNYIKSRLK